MFRPNEVVLRVAVQPSEDVERQQTLAGHQQWHADAVELLGPKPAAVCSAFGLLRFFGLAKKGVALVFSLWHEILEISGKSWLFIYQRGFDPSIQ